jgi:hypothetical protein
MASRQTTQLLSNLQNSGLSHSDPTVYDVMRRIILQMDVLSSDVFDMRSLLPGGSSSVYPANIVDFTYSFTLNNIILSWNSLGAGYFYEIREGTVWETASYLTTTITNQVPLDPRVSGNYTFLIKALSGVGVYSPTATSVTVTIPVIGSITVNTQVVDNNILFTWTAPTSVFRITHYDIYKGVNLLGFVYATFFTYFEVAGGTYSYSIRATDVAGNLSPNEVSATVVVSAPPDYVNQGEIIDTTFSGTKTHAAVISGILYFPFDNTITYQNHFDDNSWASPAAQVTAGYSAFIQPTEATGSYVKVFDFGALLSNAVVNVAYTSTNLIGVVGIVCTIETSPDNSTWDTPVVGSSAFAASLRYVRVTLDFTPTTVLEDFAQISELKCSLVIKLENDGGNIAAVSTDVAGTVVTLNKTFYSIRSITATVKQTTTRFIVIDFDYTIVNPTTFTVLVFDETGTRVSDTIGWQARGILTLGA